MCAYFVDKPHNLEIDSFKIAVSEHILLYFKNSNSFFLCTHYDVRHTLCMLCVISWFTSTLALSIGTLQRNAPQITDKTNYGKQIIPSTQRLKFTEYLCHK